MERTIPDLLVELYEPDDEWTEQSIFVPNKRYEWTCHREGCPHTQALHQFANGLGASVSWSENKCNLIAGPYAVALIRENPGSPRWSHWGTDFGYVALHLTEPEVADILKKISEGDLSWATNEWHHAGPRPALRS